MTKAKPAVEARADDALAAPRAIAVDDIVKLAAGGPEMVVREVHPGLVTVEWASDQGEKLTASFPSENLSLVRPAKSDQSVGDA